MSVEDERFDPSRFVPPWVRFEHEQRYAFAARFVRGATVVDCACGSGEGTLAYARAGARKIYAYDISREAVAETARKCTALHQVTSSTADATSIPLPDSSADVFIALETIEHLTEQERFVSEVTRVLKPGGTFICSTPNRKVYSPGFGPGDKPWNTFHTHELSAEEFSKMLGAQFEQTNLFGQNPVRAWRQKAADRVARTFGPIYAVRFNQLLKTPRFVLGHRSGHAVVRASDVHNFEYMISVSSMARHKCEP
jgi:ubiquinone/menaquinone biosynthesis C-methylase UbiE